MHLPHPLTAITLSAAALALSAAPVFAGSFSLSPNPASLNPDQTTTVTVSVDTGGAHTVGADVLLNFDHNLLQLDSVTFTGSPFPQNFSHTNQAAGTTKLTSAFTSPSDSYQGTSTLAELHFKALSTGTATISFTCTSGATNDTNLVERLTAADLVDCAALSQAAITITTPDTGQDQDTNQDNTSNNQGSNQNTATSTPCTDLPPRPTNVRSAVNGASSVLLSWDYGPGATDHYALYYGPGQDKLYYTVGNIGYTNVFLVSYLNPATSYVFGIAAVNSCGQSETIYTLNKTTGKAAAGGTAPSPTPMLDKLTGFANLISSSKATAKPRKAVADESAQPTPTPTPAPEPPEASPTIKSTALLALITIPLLLLLLFLLRRRRQGRDLDLSEDDLNLPPADTLNPPPAENNTYSQVDNHNQETAKSDFADNSSHTPSDSGNPENTQI